MNLIIILGTLAAINLGIVYVGSENYEGQTENQSEGVVEIEEVSNQPDSATTPEVKQEPENATQAQ